MGCIVISTRQLCIDGHIIMTESTFVIAVRLTKFLQSATVRCTVAH
jgi:hypothetical protein